MLQQMEVAHSGLEIKIQEEGRLRLCKVMEKKMKDHQVNMEKQVIKVLKKKVLEKKNE